MEINDSKQKYLKYKEKYLSLKRDLSMQGDNFKEKYLSLAKREKDISMQGDRFNINNFNLVEQFGGKMEIGTLVEYLNKDTKQKRNAQIIATFDVEKNYMIQFIDNHERLTISYDDLQNNSKIIKTNCLETREVDVVSSSSSEGCLPSRHQLSPEQLRKARTKRFEPEHSFCTIM
jgi:hypothetical protein